MLIHKLLMPLLGFVLFLFLFSCKQNRDYSKEVAQLDSLAIILAESEKILLSADTLLFKRNLDSFVSLRSVSGKISGDTIHKAMAMFLLSVYKHSGNILNFLQNKSYLQKAITESKRRISDLKHDLINNLIEQKKAVDYLINETNAASQISEMIKKSIATANSSAAKLDSMRTQIIYLSDSLKLK